MSKIKELQYIIISTGILSVLFVLAWFFSNSIDISSELIGNGYLYYSLLQFNIINPLLINIFILMFTGLSILIATLVFLRYSNNSPYSFFLAIIYCLNPWLIYYQGKVQIIFLYLFAAPLILLLLSCKKNTLYSITLYLAIFITILIIPYAIFIIPALIIFAVLSEKKQWHKNEYTIIGSIIISAFLIQVLLINNNISTTSIGAYLFSGIDLSTLLSVFPHYSIANLLYLFPMQTDLIPRLPIGLITLLALYSLLYRKKINSNTKLILGLCILLIILALGPTLYLSITDTYPMLMPYSLLYIIIPFIQHHPDTILFLCGLLLLLLLNQFLQKQLTNNKQYLFLHIGIIAILFIQVLPNPILTSSIYHYSGYDKLNRQPYTTAILEFNELEEQIFSNYRLQRYRDNNQLTISSSAEIYDEVNNFLNGYSSFIPQNNYQDYNNLLIRRYNITVLDDIFCAQPFLSDEPIIETTNHFSTLPLNYSIIHQDKCHTLAKLDEPTIIPGILLFSKVDENKRRIYQNDDLKIINGAKLHYINLTDIPQEIEVTLTVGADRYLSTTLSTNSKKTETIYLPEKTKNKQITFSFIADPQQIKDITFVLKNKKNNEITNNSSKSGLLIQNIEYSINENVKETHAIQIKRATNNEESQISDMTQEDEENIETEQGDKTEIIDAPTEIDIIEDDTIK